MIILKPEPSLKVVFLDRPSILLMPTSTLLSISTDKPFCYLFEFGPHDKHDPRECKEKPPLHVSPAIGRVFLTEANLIDVSTSYLPPKLDEHAPSAYSAMLSIIANRDPAWKGSPASDGQLEWMQRFFPGSLFYLQYIPKNDTVIKINRPPMTNVFHLFYLQVPSKRRNNCHRIDIRRKGRLGHKPDSWCRPQHRRTRRSLALRRPPLQQ